jgi:hypothetical protein
VIVLSEYLTIGSVPLATPNCKIRDVLPLVKHVMRGENTKLPGVEGVAVNPVRTDSLAETLEVLLRGDIDDDGVATADAREGLGSLVRSLRQSITGSQTATLHMGGWEGQATVQVRRFDPVSTGPFTATLLLQVEVPSGGFEETP